MSIWQTKSWQEMLKKSEQVSEFFEVNNIFLEKRKVALGEYWLFILWLEKELSEKDASELIEICKKENCLFLQIETLNYTSPQPSPSEEREQEQKKVASFSPKGEGIQGWGWYFKKWYYKKFITPYTSVINTQESEDEILAKMKPKGRYNIKVAVKKWIEVNEVEKNDKNIKEYYDLMLETTSRDSFSWNNMDYYKTFLNSLKQSKLLLAYKDEKVIAGWIFTFEDNVSIYYYWASTSDKEYRNLMAPYMLQWEAIKIAKKTSSKLFDFLWVAWENEKNSPLSWVTDFKLKLSKDVRNVSDSYIWINKWFKYFIINILRKLK